ncbi:MAG: 50S ribosomal protein L3 [Verrucomicrobiales bacterium]
MSIGLLGKKLGMTRVFDEDGNAIPVTVIDVSDNAYVQLRTSDKDGYSAVQIGYDSQKPARLTLPEIGHLKKWKSGPKKFIREFRVESDEDLPNPGEGAPGVETFQAGQWVDVVGTSKGKGFQGVYRRFNFGGAPMSHGSMMHRRTGGIGAGTTPGRVWKNAKMPGRMGGDRITVQNLKVVQARAEDKVLLISGAVPGAKGGYVIIRPAKKKPAPESK